METTKDVTDFTDWQDTRVPSLSRLDAALRCQVCKDYFNGPMLMPCGHTFCSLCIRKCLDIPPVNTCPSCRFKGDATSLKPNHTMQEVMSSFLAARAAMMSELKKAPPPPPTPQPTASTNSRKNYQDDNEEAGAGNGNGRRRSQKQVVRANSGADSDYSETASNSQQLRRSTRSRRTNGATPSLPPPGTEIIGIDDDEDEREDEENLRRETTRKKKNAKNEEDDGDYDPEGEVVREEIKQVVQEVDDGLVACPICGNRISNARINIHLDKCLKGMPDNSMSPQKSSLQSSIPFQKPPAVFALSKPPPTIDVPKERLAKLNYHTIKENVLRAKCREHGILSTGSKAQVEKRYTEWVNIYNANLDSAQPKSKNALIRDLEKWERQEAMGAANEARNPFKQDGYDHDKWAEKHSDDYKALIAKAKATAGAKRRKVTAEGDEDSPMEGGEVDRKETLKDELDTTRRKSPAMITTTNKVVVAPGINAPL